MIPFRTLLLCVLLLPGLAPAADKGSTAAGDWKTEFEEVAAGTADVMNAPDSELKKMLERCERLRKAVEAEEPTVRKVYLKRLQMSCDLYRYILERRAEEAKTKAD